MSYSNQDLEAYLTRHALAATAADYIRQASAGLARDMGNGRYASVVTEYQSRKMGVTVHTESRTAEYVYAIHLDFDQDVEAFFEQPPAVDCYRMTKKGYRRVSTYVPDTLVLGVRGPYVVQVKTEKELQSKVASSQDWILRTDGTYQDLAAEGAFQKLGLPHTVISTHQLSKLQAANISLLLQSLKRTQSDKCFEAKVIADLKKHPVTSLMDVRQRIKITDFSPLLRLIATHVIHTDLTRFSLTEPDACFLTTDPKLLRKDVFAAWSAFRRCPPSMRDITADGGLLPISRHLSRGVEIIELIDSGLKNRNTRRWARKIEDGIRAGKSKVVAATPRYDLSGNSLPKRPVVVLAFAEHSIRSAWCSDAMPSFPAMWRIYKKAAENWHPAYKRVSLPTFRKLFDSLSLDLAEGRGGRRAANAAAAPSNVEDRALKASRPFELASCDHYLCDLDCEVLAANDMIYTMRPWLTVLRDCHTKSVLAYWLSLRNPSRRSCALIIRQCVQIHGRLPESIIVDRGPEFQSAYFSGLLAHCQVNLMIRPAAHPRFGSEAERLFGQYKSLWMAMRPGNRISMKEVRSVSASRQPQSLACLSLLDLWEDLEEFNKWLNFYSPTASSPSPSVLAEQGLFAFPCSGRVVAYDDTFVIASAVDDGNYVIDRRRGLHIGDFHYWHPGLTQASRNSVPVRRDPQDPFRVYAFVSGSWLTCTASNAVRQDMKHPLRQAVEGVIALDGKELRKAVRDDADYALIEALGRRNSRGVEGPLPDTPAPPPAPIDMLAANDPDPFVEVAEQDLDPLGITKW